MLEKIFHFGSKKNLNGNFSIFFKNLKIWIENYHTSLIRKFLTSSTLPSLIVLQCNVDGNGTVEPEVAEQASSVIVRTED